MTTSSRKSGIYIKVTPWLQADAEDREIPLHSLEKRNGPLFKKWYKIFREDAGAMFKLEFGHALKIKCVKDASGMHIIVYPPKDATQESLQMIISYSSDALDDDGNYPISYKGQTYFVSARCVVKTV